MERIIFHVDMNAFFASVEQQINPILRGRAFGVGGKIGTRSVIVAASREAKRQGVSSIMNAYEALRVAPNLLLVDGTPDAYADIHGRLVRIFRRFTHLVEVFSIDEAWLDMTGYVATYAEARLAALRMKRLIFEECGSQLSCSVGIAPNKALAKLASDKEKPNGLVVIRPQAALAVLDATPLSDVLSIGPRIAARLEQLGISTFPALRAAPLPVLQQAFGVLGHRYHALAHGEDKTPVISQESPPQSIGNSYTMPTDTENRLVFRRYFLALAEKVTTRLRAQHYAARHIHIWVRYSDKASFWHRSTTLEAPFCEARTLLRATWHLLWKDQHPLPFRALGVSVSGLIPVSALALPLWHKDRQYHRVLPAIDVLQARYGRGAVQPASLVHTALRRHVSGFTPRDT